MDKTKVKITPNPEAPICETIHGRSKSDQEASDLPSVKSANKAGVNQEQIQQADVVNQDHAAGKDKNKLACIGLSKVKQPEGRYVWIRRRDKKARLAAEAVAEEAGKFGVAVMQQELPGMNKEQTSQTHEKPVAINHDTSSDNEQDTFERETYKAVLDKTYDVVYLEPSNIVTKEAFFTNAKKHQEEEQEDAVALEKLFDASSKGLDESLKIGMPAGDTAHAAVKGDRTTLTPSVIQEATCMKDDANNGIGDKPINSGHAILALPLAGMNKDKTSSKHQVPVAMNRGDASSDNEQDTYEAVLDKTYDGVYPEPSNIVTKEAFFPGVENHQEEKQEDAVALEKLFDASSKGLYESLKIGMPVGEKAHAAVKGDQTTLTPSVIQKATCMKEDANSVIGDKPINLGHAVLVLPAGMNKDEVSLKHQEPVAMNRGDASSDSEEGTYKDVLDKTYNVVYLEPSDIVTKQAFFTDVEKHQEEKQEDAVALEKLFDASSTSLDESLKIGMPVGNTAHAPAKGDQTTLTPSVIQEATCMKDDDEKEALALEERCDALSKGLNVSMKIGTSVSEKASDATVKDKLTTLTMAMLQESSNLTKKDAHKEVVKKRMVLGDVHLEKQASVPIEKTCLTTAEEAKPQDYFELAKETPELSAKTASSLTDGKLVTRGPTSLLVKDVAGAFKRGEQTPVAKVGESKQREDKAADGIGARLKEELAKPKKEPIRRVPRSVPAGFQVASAAAKGAKVGPKTSTTTTTTVTGRKTLPGQRASLGPSTKLKPTIASGRNSLPPMKAPAFKDVEKEVGSANEVPKAIVVPTRVLRSQTRAGAQAGNSATTSSQATNTAASVNRAKSTGIVAGKAVAGVKQVSNGENKENQTMLMNQGQTTVNRAKGIVAGKVVAGVKQVTDGEKKENQTVLMNPAKEVTRKSNAATNIKENIDSKAKDKVDAGRVSIKSVGTKGKVSTSGNPSTNQAGTTPKLITCKIATVPTPREQGESKENQTVLMNAAKEVTRKSNAATNIKENIDSKARDTVDAGRVSRKSVGVKDKVATSGNPSTNQAGTTPKLIACKIATVPTPREQGESKENQTGLMNPAKETTRKSNAATNIKENIDSKAKDRVNAGCVSRKSVGMKDKVATSGNPSTNQAGTAPKLVTSKITTVPTPRLSTARLGAVSKAGKSHAADKDQKEPIKAMPRSVPAGFQLAGSAVKGSKVTGVKGKQDDALKGAEAKQTRTAVAQRNEMAIKKMEKKN